MVSDAFDGHEAIGDMAPDILGHLRLKITIKGIFAATK
jgi:hypothetical protein